MNRVTRMRFLQNMEANKVADNQLSNMLLLILSQEFLFPFHANNYGEHFSLFTRLMTYLFRLYDFEQILK